MACTTVAIFALLVTLGVDRNGDGMIDVNGDGQQDLQAAAMPDYSSSVGDMPAGAVIMDFLNAYHDAFHVV
jgi:hypothetical protein